MGHRARAAAIKNRKFSFSTATLPYIRDTILICKRSLIRRRYKLSLKRILLRHSVIVISHYWTRYFFDFKYFYYWVLKLTICNWFTLFTSWITRNVNRVDFNTLVHFRDVIDAYANSCANERSSPLTINNFSSGCTSETIKRVNSIWGNKSLEMWSRNG